MHAFCIIGGSKDDLTYANKSEKKSITENVNINNSQ